MSETNGKSRLDRIEEILDRHSTMVVSIEATIERSERANEAAHERFDAEDKRLLTAQILMNGALKKLADTTQNLTDTTQSLADTTQSLADTTQSLADTTQSLADTTQTLADTTQRVVDSLGTLELKMEETTEKLNALINTVDGLIRKPGTI